jgi:hypothetical protein
MPSQQSLEPERLFFPTTTHFLDVTVFTQDVAHDQLITCITLEDLIRQAGIAKIDLIKIDCQGAEYEILYGLSPTHLLASIRLSLNASAFLIIHSGRNRAGGTLRNQGFSVFNQGNLLHAAR